MSQAKQKEQDIQRYGIWTHKPSRHNMETQQLPQWNSRQLEHKEVTLKCNKAMFFSTSIWQESLFIVFFPTLLKNQEREDFAEDMQKTVLVFPFLTVYLYTLANQLFWPQNLNYQE